MMNIPDDPIIRCMEATGYPYWNYPEEEEEDDEEWLI